jgi:hypothetical protein
MYDDQRGLRFSFVASAEVLLDNASGGIPARVTELSLRGCFLELSAPLEEQQRIVVKIFSANDYFEAPAEVLYVKPTGVAVVFGNVNPQFSNILQK